MLTKEQYTVLRNLRDGVSFDEDEVFEILRELSRNGYAHSTNYKSYNFMFNKACNFIITECGKSACEEYEKSIRQENREINSLEIAKDANKKATQANKISIWAIVVSIILSISSIIASILISLCLNPL